MHGEPCRPGHPAGMAPQDFGTARAARADNRQDFRAGEWWAPHRGVRLPSWAIAHRDLIDATLAVSPPEAVVSGVTAPILWHAPVPRRVLGEPVEITVPPGGFHVSRPGVTCRRRFLHPEHVTVHEGRRVTSPVRVVIDLAVHLSAAELVAVADDFIRRGLLTEDFLRHWAHRLRRRHGIGRVREILDYVDPAAESPRESMMRYVLWRAGYVDLKPNVDIHSASGQFIARGDLVDADRKIVVEYDGAHHLTRSGQASDADRRLRLSSEGWMEVTVVAEDLYPETRLLRKVALAYGARR